MNQPAQRHLFILGFFRSGTSLLYNFLNLHPQIKLLFEADLLNHPLVSVSALTGKKWWERLDFYNGCCQRHRLDILPSWSTVRSSKQAADILYHQYGGDHLYLGEKAPSYYNCIPKLVKLFPNARFIVIWRHPQRVVSSILDAGRTDHFFLNRSLPLRSLLGFEKMQADVLALRARGLPVYDLCFEELAENPEGHLKSICHFLEIPFDPRMLDLDLADCSMFHPGESHAKAKSGHLLKPGRIAPPPATSLERKARAYLQRSKQLFGNQLSTKLYWPGDGVRAPNVFEVLWDRVNYEWARIYSERIIPTIYGSFPLAWLQIYRDWRRKKFASATSSQIRVVHKSAVHPLTISVITPSYKQLPWLKLCAASVGDQSGVTVEHIIQDAQSGPELEAWVRQNTRAKLFVECDSGMYDAINRGFARATGDIVCWLNSDEQYLEGTLARVARYFEAHPEIDILFGDALLINNAGTLLSYRRTVEPNVWHIQAAHLNTLSCATFIRRSVLDRGFKLDTRWKAIADAVWIVELLRGGISTAVLNEPLAAFTITDSNLGQTSLALSEAKLWQGKTFPTYRYFRPYFVARYRLTKLLWGAYWPRSIATRLYTLANPEKRVLQQADHLGFSWPRTG